jgi:hypothetical protein
MLDSRGKPWHAICGVISPKMLGMELEHIHIISVMLDHTKQNTKASYAHSSIVFKSDVGDCYANRLSMIHLYKSSTSDSLRPQFIPQISPVMNSIYDDEADPASAIAAALASARLLFSPCFPFCVNCPVSQDSFFDHSRHHNKATYRPLCEP